MRRRARSAVLAELPDLLLVDAYLPDGDGIAFVQSVSVDAFVLSAATEAATVRRALRAGALTYLMKPFDAQTLADRLARYQRYRNLVGGDGTLRQEDLDRALAILGGDPGGSVSRSATEQVILTALGTAEASSTEIAERAGVSRATAQRHLSALAARSRGRAAALRHHGTTRAPVLATRALTSPGTHLRAAGERRPAAGGSAREERSRPRPRGDHARVDQSAQHTSSGWKNSRAMRAASLSRPNAGRLSLAWAMLPGKIAMKNAARIAPTRRRSFGSTTSAAPSMISTAPDATTTPSLSMGRTSVTRSGTCAWNSFRAQNRWLSPANTIPPASSQRVNVLIGPVCRRRHRAAFAL